MALDVERIANHSVNIYAPKNNTPIYTNIPVRIYKIPSEAFTYSIPYERGYKAILPIDVEIRNGYILDDGNKKYRVKSSNTVYQTINPHHIEAVLERID
jgi:hypothetical protein